MTKVVRRTHMYLALVLGPWMAAYALSTIVMGHGLTAPQSYTVERTVRYDAVFAANIGPREQASQILRALDLDGHFTVQGPDSEGRLTIIRQHLLTPTRIVYRSAEHQVRIERGAFQATTFLNRFHHRRTYDEPFVPDRAMAVSIDLVAVTMAFWVLSGVWMWWEMRATRVWGLVAALGGLTLFLFFAWVA